MNVESLRILLKDADSKLNVIVTVGKRTYEAGILDIKEGNADTEGHVELRCVKPKKESAKMQPMTIDVRVRAEVSSSISKGMRAKLVKNFKPTDELKEPDLQWFAEEKVIQMLFKPRLRGVKIRSVDTVGRTHRTESSEINNG